MFIFYFVNTKHQVSLNCNKNKEISVANLMMQYRDLFPLRNKYNVVFVLNGLNKRQLSPSI